MLRLANMYHLLNKLDVGVYKDGSVIICYVKTHKQFTEGPLRCNESVSYYRYTL